MSITSESVRHFLTLRDCSAAELNSVISRAIELKALHKLNKDPQDLCGRVLGLMFEKSSTRTRVSFECAMIHLGGAAVFLSPRDTQLGRGEPIEDTARVLSRMVDAIAVRTFEHEKLMRFARYSEVPVINALTDQYHPCQLLADVQTFVEHRGSIDGRTVAWVGDGNNMCHSYMNAASGFGFELRIAHPDGYAPDAAVLEANRDAVHIVCDPCHAVAGADLVVTDAWVSMGQEDTGDEREVLFEPYRVDERLMTYAKPDALVMHCLPAYRGKEVTPGVLDGPQSVIWDEAENRLHAQKALLEFLLRS